MKRGRAAWVLVFAMTAVGAIVTYDRCPGCIPRDRINDNCEWTGDARFPIDSAEQGHRDHLTQDAQLAEELAIRNADAEHGRRFAVAHHGGLLDNGRFRQECLSQLFGAIEDHHGATADEIQLARGVRNPVFDLAVVLLFLPFYSLVAVAVCRWLNRRFPPDEPLARMIATGLVSMAIAFLGVQCFRLWGAVWEVIRVGNGHMTSIRVASTTRWVHQYAGADLLGAILVFWLVALIGSRFVTDLEYAPGTCNPGPWL